MAQSPEILAILADLAAGRISPAVAADRVDAIRNAAKAAAPAAGDASAPPEPRLTVPPPHGESRGVRRVSVRAVGRRVRISGDNTIATVAVDGTHTMRRIGTVMEVLSDGDIGPQIDGFSLLRPPRSWEEVRSMSLGKELVVRVNPALLVDVEVTGGALLLTRVPYLGRIRITAGGATCTDVAMIEDALIQAGSATIRGTIDTGRSRVRVESGHVDVTLAPTSNVTISTQTQLGKIHWVGLEGPDVDQFVMGNGTATLNVDVVMGYATIRAPHSGTESRS